MPRLIPPVIPAGAFRRQAQPSLTTERGLVLRPWSAEDVPALVAAYEDPAIRHWHHRTMTPDEAAAWVVGSSRRWADETDAEWAVVAGSVPVGRVALRGVDLATGQGEVSYWTSPGSRGHGFASDAVRRTTSWALHTMGFWRLEIRHSVENPASCRVASRAGFLEEARLACQHLHEDGWHDVHVHRRLRVEEPTV